VLLMSDVVAGTPNAAQAECQRAWQGLNGHPAGSDALLAAWKGYESRCKGTGVYEVRLASILADRDEYDLARQVLQTSTIPGNYRKQSEVAEITIDYLQAVATGDRERLERLEGRAAKFGNANPGEIPVLAMLGHTRVILEKYEPAIAPLESVVRSGHGLLGDHRNLTVAYANSGHYQKALEMLDKTYSMSKQVTSDEEFMYAATLAYAANGKVDAAKSMLTLIVNKKPELQHDPRFAQTVLKAKQLSNGKLQ
jgi:lipopolysaccharide biosynthesis regulator YciM